VTCFQAPRSRPFGLCRSNLAAWSRAVDVRNARSGSLPRRSRETISARVVRLVAYSDGESWLVSVAAKMLRVLGRTSESGRRGGERASLRLGHWSSLDWRRLRSAQMADNVTRRLRLPSRWNYRLKFTRFWSGHFGCHAPASGGSYNASSAKLAQSCEMRWPNMVRSGPCHAPASMGNRL
jgi:hypothetical protein